MKIPCDWTCPYCGKPTTITYNDLFEDTVYLRIDNKEGNRGVHYSGIVYLTRIRS